MDEENLRVIALLARYVPHIAVLAYIAVLVRAVLLSLERVPPKDENKETDHE